MTIVKNNIDTSSSSVLLSCLALPILVLLAFGGQPSFIVICFGLLVSYIFDLLGAIEVMRCMNYICEISECNILFFSGDISYVSNHNNRSFECIILGS